MFSLKHTNVVNYTDDNTLCSITENLQRVIQKLFADTGICLDWFENYIMQANPGKFHFMLTGNHEMQLTLYDVVLDQEYYVNLLCVKIDKRLSFKFNVNEVCRKTGRQLNALRRQPILLNMNAKMNVFNAFVRANLNYCPLVWINRNKTDIGRLEKVQEHALWLVYNNMVSTYQDLLYRANIPSVLTKWQRILLTEVYKAI